MEPSAVMNSPVEISKKEIPHTSLAKWIEAKKLFSL